MKKVKKRIEGILDVAKESPTLKHEVALAGIKNVGDTVDKLQDLNKKLKDLKKLQKQQMQI